jgi:probable rRNA maturation factor
MDIVIDNRSERELPLEQIPRLATFVLKRELAERGMTRDDLELSLSFVDIGEIAQLNAAYRGKAEPTDVLSFELDDPWEGLPQGEAHGEEHDEEHDEEHGEGRGKERGKEERLLLGDIVIQPDIARERAVAEEVGFEEELWILVIHGILHLLGYDHLTEQDAARMEAREDEHFCQWELSRNA